MKKNNKKQLLKISKDELVDTFSLPRDLTLGASIVTSIGNLEMVIENYKGIVEYSSNIIVVQGKKTLITVQGKALSIDYYTNDDMKITGIIHSISYV